MAVSAKTPKVFISFVNEDKDVATAVKLLIETRLSLHGRVFLSTELVAGDDWLAEIRGAIESSELLVVMLSSRSLKRSWINFETGAAWILKRPIIPVCFGALKKSALPHPYSNFQAVQLPGDEDELLEGIHRKLDLLVKSPRRTFQKPGTFVLGDPYAVLSLALKHFRDEI
jgi:hypothetical protein